MKITRPIITIVIIAYLTSGCGKNDSMVIKEAEGIPEKDTRFLNVNDVEFVDTDKIKLLTFKVPEDIGTFYNATLLSDGNVLLAGSKKLVRRDEGGDFLDIYVLKWPETSSFISCDSNGGVYIVIGETGDRGLVPGSPTRKFYDLIDNELILLEKEKSYLLNWANAVRIRWLKKDSFYHIIQLNDQWVYAKYVHSNVLVAESKDGKSDSMKLPGKSSDYLYMDYGYFSKEKRKLLLPIIKEGKIQMLSMDSGWLKEGDIWTDPRRKIIYSYNKVDGIMTIEKANNTIHQEAPNGAP